MKPSGNSDTRTLGVSYSKFVIIKVDLTADSRIYTMRIALLLLFFVFAGPGPWSVDVARRRVS